MRSGRVHPWADFITQRTGAGGEMFPGKPAPRKARPVGVAALPVPVQHVRPRGSLDHMGVRAGRGADTDRHVTLVHQDPEAGHGTAGRQVKGVAVGTDRHGASVGVERVPAVSVIGDGGRPQPVFIRAGAFDDFGPKALFGAHTSVEILLERHHQNG